MGDKEEVPRSNLANDLGCIFILFLFCMITSTVFIIEIPFYLLFGWVHFLGRVWPNISWDYRDFVLPTLFLFLFLWGTHRFLSWFYENYAWKDIITQRWPWKWSLIGVTVFFLMFVTSISLIGILHQIVWLLKEPFVVQQGRSEQALAKNTLRHLHSVFEIYKEECGSFPVTSGTVDLDKTILPEKYWGEEYTDRWDSPYRYTSNGKSYTLRSYGKNKVLGGGEDGEFDDLLICENGFLVPYQPIRIYRNMK